MDIHIPKHLRYQETKQFISQYFQQSLTTEDNEWNFDWTGVEWIDLPEAVSILNWSTKLVQYDKSVTWTFRHPLSPILGIDDLRNQARLVLGEDTYQRLLNQLRRLQQKLVRGQLYLKTRTEVLSQIRSEIKTRGEKTALVADQWLEAETFSLRYADVLAYLARYGFFTGALQAGIVVTPDPRRLPKSIIYRKPDTPSLELQSVHSWTEVDMLLERLSSSEELARILGEYANLDVVRRGALASILITELGRNIGEHSAATSAWVCTRLVKAEQVNIQTEGDPALKAFRDTRQGFLEIIVCDNGGGLTNGLERVLEKDQRNSVRSKYRSENGHFKEHDLIDYAFDRLSSIKRNIVELVHLVEKPSYESGKVASGLYWVWNVVRSHHGVLSVRTGTTCGWYDFTVSGDRATQSWEQTLLDVDSSSAPFCGTMIRICFPLAEAVRYPPSQRRYQRQQKKRRALPGASHISSPQTMIVWAGDIARRVKTLGPHISVNTRKTQRLDMVDMFEADLKFDYQIRLLQELESQHFPLHDGDTLVLDLCGLQHRWVMDSINPLCHFVTEMNYTSTVGRSTVVLWNVPISEAELFEKGMEDAIGTYAHLQGFRRATLLVWDSGQVRFFCGWPEAERILSTFEFESELRLDDIGLNTLARDDQERLRKLISENSHLLEWTARDQVRIRPWPLQLNFLSWQRGIQWFNELLSTNIQRGGVLNTIDLGYYRLPSTGLLVKSFYQFDVLLYNQQACARIIWLLAQIIAAIENQGKKIEWIVTATRPVMSLATDLANNYHLYRHNQAPRLLVENTVEELEARREEIADGTAIILTDVISSGSLCKQIRMALPDVKWLGILALLDTRDITHQENIQEQFTTIFPGWDLRKTYNTELGDVYPLVQKYIEKIPPEEAGGEPITPIDKINVCPVEFSDISETRKRDIWPFIKYKDEAIMVGHYQAEEYHHYIYYVNVLKLLEAVDPNDGRSLREFMVQTIMGDLARTNFNSDKAIIFHPPRKTSYAEVIAKEVQSQTGILQRLILYRDSLAGHWRFSPFVKRGIRFTGYTAVLIDDGSNTGETLMGLLDAATFGQPSCILAYTAITRMPLHKAHLLGRLNSLKGVSSDTRIQFMVSLNIPVYSPRTCPICRFRRGLSDLSTSSSLFMAYADEMMNETEAGKVGSAATEGSLLLWKYTTPYDVSRLREEIELANYTAGPTPILDGILKKAETTPTGTENSNDSLLDLAFVLCTEPDLVESAILAQHLTSLLERTFARIESCKEDELMTYTGLAYVLMLRLQRRSPESNLRQDAELFWQAMFKRRQLTVLIMGRVVAFMLARALAERGIGGGSHVALCTVFASQLLERLSSRANRSTKNGYSLIEGYGCLFAREMIATLEGAGHISGYTVGLSRGNLLELAISTAAKFRGHAAEHVTYPINRLSKVFGYKKELEREEARVSVGELVEGFDKLHQLQHSLYGIEQSSRLGRGQEPGAVFHWGHPDLRLAIDRYGKALMQIVEAIEGSKEIIDIWPLQEAWRSLQSYLMPAFDDIFPVVYEVFDERWSKWDDITGLPSNIQKPLDRITPDLDRESVFIPRMLLSRFFTVTMENLRTAAFKDWTETQLNEEAWAMVSIGEKEDSEGHSIISVQVSDNGCKYHMRVFSTPSRAKAAGHGLSQISEMAKLFGGELVGPYGSVRGEKEVTVIELRMKRNITKSKGDQFGTQ